MTDKLKVLVACEYSGAVRNAFRDLGHDAWSCDLEPADDGSKYHHQGDVLPLLEQYWDLLIAHPPCTYLANSGVCHLHTDPDRWPLLDAGAEFFMQFWDAKHIKRRAIENPVMHGHGKKRINNMKQMQVIQPYHFGHLEQKATCLWLDGLMPLRHTSDLKAETMALPSNVRQRLHYLPPSPERWKLRSATYPGIAAAMAEQWGGQV